MILKQILRRGMGKVSTLPKINPTQEASLLETCILVNERDEFVGTANKKECHLVPANGDIPLHRAFSVFLFNTKNELLLQKRSDTKVTFPSHFTNTCCSHPLFDFEEERQEENALGVRLAAQRRLNYELGIPKDLIMPSDFTYLTRILYKSEGNGIWGEHEVDYILIMRKDVPINPNPNEVSEVCYVSKEKLSSFVNNLKVPLTPWFQLLIQNKLNLWWNSLDNLNKYKDHVNIINFT